MQKKYIANSRDVVSKIFDNEALLINLASGRYYTLSSSGTIAWILLKNESFEQEINQSLCQIFALADSEPQDALRSFIKAMLEEGLIISSDGGSALSKNNFELENANWGTYSPPTLSAHDDIAHLLALDPPYVELQQSFENNKP